MAENIKNQAKPQERNLRYGDPDDKSLMNVERENSVMKLLVHKTAREKCYAEIAHFEDCKGKYGMGCIFYCRKERDIRDRCLLRWYWDPEYVQECTKLYLDDRSERRRKVSSLETPS